MKEHDREQLLRSNSKKGTNQIAVRSYNERLVLQLVREHETLTKAEATRATGLSANASSVIFRSLENEGLLIRDEPIRGRIGQPSTPLRINPDAHYYASLKIGRRSFELAVIDFVGQIKAIKRIQVSYPTTTGVLDFLKSELSGVLRAAKKSRKAISGMGVALPSELWSWTEEIGASKEEMALWKDFDVVDEIGKIVPWEIVVENDGTAACRAEQVFGPHADKQDWIYFFVGTFIGGGVVLNGSVFPGRRGNAGGFGPMRVPKGDGGDRLVDHASLVVLERMIAADGGEPHSIYDESLEWECFEPNVERWIDRAAENLVHAIVSSLSILDFESVVIDGAVPDKIKARLVSAVSLHLEKTDLQGITAPKIEQGHAGRRARIVGAAAKLISENYLIDQDTLLRK